MDAGHRTLSQLSGTRFTRPSTPPLSRDPLTLQRKRQDLNVLSETGIRWANNLTRETTSD